VFESLLATLRWDREWVGGWGVQCSLSERANRAFGRRKMFSYPLFCLVDPTYHCNECV